MIAGKESEAVVVEKLIRSHRLHGVKSAGVGCGALESSEPPELLDVG